MVFEFLKSFLKINIIQSLKIKKQKPECSADYSFLFFNFLRTFSKEIILAKTLLPVND